MSVKTPSVSTEGEKEKGALHSPSLQGIRVLLVDDDPSAREAISAFLATLEAQVELASSAKEA